MVLAMGLALASIAFSQTHGSALSTTPCDFGEKYQFSEVSCEIEVANSGSSPIEITEVSAKSATDRISPSSLTVPPRGVVYLKATINTLNGIGRVPHYFGFTTNEAGQAKRNTEVRGFVSSVLDDAVPVLDFGVVNLDETLPTKDIALATREVADFRITKILEKPDYLDVKLNAKDQSLTAKIRADIPWGLHNDYIKVEINSPQQPQVWIKVKVDAHGDIVPGDNPYGFGLLREGNKNEVLIRLSSRKKKDFEIGAIRLEGIAGSTEVIPCEPVEKGCRAIRFLLGQGQTLGQLKGQLSVELPEYKRTLPIIVWGMYVGADTKVRSFEEEAAKNAAAEASKGAQSISPAGMQSAIKHAIKSASTTSPPGNGPLLKWNVANEQMIYGYIIYRSDQEDGPFLRVNNETIKAAAEDGVNSDYQWRDNSAQSGNVYWYSIGMVYKDGHKQQLTGPQKVLAK